MALTILRIVVIIIIINNIQLSHSYEFMDEITV